MNIPRIQDIGDATTCPVAVVVQDGKLLIGHRHYTADKWKPISVWTMPGGRCDEGETLEATLRREVAEETGIHLLEIEKYLGDLPGAKEGDTVVLFLCRTVQSARLMEPEKFSEWAWLPLRDFTRGMPSSFINEGARSLIIERLRG